MSTEEGAFEKMPFFYRACQMDYFSRSPTQVPRRTATAENVTETLLRKWRRIAAKNDRGTTMKRSSFCTPVRRGNGEYGWFVDNGALSTRYRFLLLLSVGTGLRDRVLIVNRPQLRVRVTRPVAVYNEVVDSRWSFCWRLAILLWWEAGVVDCKVQSKR